MNVHIRVCMVCYPKKRAAMRLAETIKHALDMDVPLEAGYHGQCEVVVNGEVLPLSQYLVGGDKTYDVLAQFVLDELRKRAIQPQAV